MFWLTLGAGLGISGYRRVTRITRSFARPAGRPAVRAAVGARARPRIRLRGIAGFARDVRDGMDLYSAQQRLNIERRRASRGHTLSAENTPYGTLPAENTPYGHALGMRQVTARSDPSAAYEGHPASRNGSSAQH
ncbi:MAG TPA: hypothetical protein VGI31_11910 [Streptosporangiaceae bacterium]